MRNVINITRSMRPKQWTKNLVLFAGVVFAKEFLNPSLLLRSILGFIVFCVLSGMIYIINDIFDRRKDKKHPAKRNRPIASGSLSVVHAVIISVTGIVVFTVFAVFLGMQFFGFALAFIIINLLYSLFLRDIVIIDVLSISFSFLARAGAGVAVLFPVLPSIQFSPWLWMCTLFLSLFLAVCKRRNEYIVLDNAAEHRGSLSFYSAHLLDQLVGLTATATLLSYSIYTVWPGTVSKFGTNNLVFTIPFVIFGIMRYLYLVYNRMRGDDPSAVLLTEKQLMIDVFLWFAVTVIIIYFS
ncbi:MAG: decaprenyl-phosphate phosphoribosyltransferase [Candidatus Krumholzibacteriota bacterium]|nr:decaprenyl-phosphate phosphoribosyltransferase [Candidatus Krumholzibacteriota bacterium]